MSAEEKSVIRLAREVSQPDFSSVLWGFHVANQHHDMQTNIMRAFLSACDHWYQDYLMGHYDVRNEACVKAAAQIVKLNLSVMKVD